MSRNKKRGQKKKSVLKKFKAKVMGGVLLLLTLYVYTMCKPVEAGAMVTMSSRSKL